VIRNHVYTVFFMNQETDSSKQTESFLSRVSASVKTLLSTRLTWELSLKRKGTWLLAGVLVLGLSPLALSFGSLTDGAPVEIGEQSPRTIVTSQPLRVEDPDATETARRNAEANINPVMVVDPQAQTAAVQQVRNIFSAVSAARTPELVLPEPPDFGEAGPPEDYQPPEPVEVVPSREQQVSELQTVLSFLDDTAIAILVDLGDTELQSLRSEVLSTIQEVVRQRISQQQVEQALQTHLTSEIALRNFTETIATSIVWPVAREVVGPTLVEDRTATDQARSAARESVSTVVRNFPVGTVVVEAGQEVDPVTYEALVQAGLEGSDPLVTLFSRFVLVFVSAFLVVVWFRKNRVAQFRRPSRMLMLSVMAFLFAVSYIPITLLSDTYTTAWMFMLPIGAVSMLATILVGKSSAFATMVLLASWVSVSTDRRTLLFMLLTGMFATMLADRRSSKAQLRRVSAVVVGAYAVLGAGVFVVFEPNIAAAGQGFFTGFVAGLSTVILVQALLPMFENVFNVLTYNVLSELTDRNHPLMRRLEEVALGTYNHSVVVSNMVERAARQVEADPVLASAQALYHDIGKVANPTYFVENQFSGNNPHDTLPPRVSAEIIIRHVADGVEMAQKFKLPPEVVDGISTHHGTTLVRFFYEKAKEEEGDANEEEFRYPHAKPWTKEAALLLLADCCESAVRAVAAADRQITRDKIESMVEGLVQGRVEDGEVDDAPLTLRDLDRIKTSFVETLVGVYHPRVTYPSNVVTPSVETKSSN